MQWNTTGIQRHRLRALFVGIAMGTVWSRSSDMSDFDTRLTRAVR